MAVSLLPNALVKLPNSFASPTIFKKEDIPVAPFPNTVTKPPVAFITVPNTNANAPNLAILVTTSGFNLLINSATVLIPSETSSIKGSKLSPNFIIEFLASFIDFLNLNSDVSAIVLKASSVKPALLAISFNVLLKYSPSLDNSDIALNPASVELHKLLNASSFPLQLSFTILRTS